MYDPYDEIANLRDYWCLDIAELAIDKKENENELRKLELEVSSICKRLLEIYSLINEINES